MSEAETRTGIGDPEDWFQEEDQPFADAQQPPAQLTDQQLEQAYDLGTARIVTQRNDFLLPNLLDSMKREMYFNLNPPYQRRLRWDRKRKWRLFESLLMNVPIPPVFLLEAELAQYEIMDGQQRLSTIQEFFNNEFPLTGLEEWPQLNGRRYGDLPNRIQSGLQRRSISAIIVLAESSGDIRRFVFERLNTGGVRLNAQEIRNAVYSGPFNDLLHELSRTSVFTLIWDIPELEVNEEKKPSQRLSGNLLYKQMIDCEIVLRFFALADEEELGTSMRKSLDETMQRHRNADHLEIDRLRLDFTDCIATAYAIYQDATFRLPKLRGRVRRPLSRALYDAVMLGLLKDKREHPAEEWISRRLVLLESAAEIVAKTDELLADPATYALLVGRLNTKASILDRIALMTAIFGSY